MAFHDPELIRRACPVLRGASTTTSVESNGHDDDVTLLPSITCREGQKAFRCKLREIYLYAVRAAYWEQLSAGALPEGLPSMMLLQSVDEAVDNSHLHGFFDWQEVQVRVRAGIVKVIVARVGTGSLNRDGPGIGTSREWSKPNLSTVCFGSCTCSQKRRALTRIVIIKSELLGA